MGKGKAKAKAAAPAPEPVAEKIVQAAAEQDDEADDDDDSDGEYDEYPPDLEKEYRRKTFSGKMTLDDPVQYDPIDSMRNVRELVLTQIALDPAAKKKCVIGCSVINEHEELVQSVICSLVPGRVDQCTVNLTFEEDVVFNLMEGDGPVYVLGSTEVVRLTDGSDEYEEDDEDDEDDDMEHLLASMKRSAGDSDDDSGDDSEDDAPPAKKSKKVAKVEELSDDDEEDVKDLVGSKLSAYIGSTDEQKDLLANYNKCGGDWDLVQYFQAGSSEEELPRYKKIMAGLIKSKKAKKFTKEQTSAIVEKLQEELGEEDLDDDAEEDDDESDAEEDDEDKDFIDDDGDDDDDEDDDEDDEAAGGAEAEGDEDDEDDEDDDDESEEEEDKKSTVLAAMMKSPNVPKKFGKFTNWAKKTFKLTDDEEIKGIWADLKDNKA